MIKSEIYLFIYLKKDSSDFIYSTFKRKYLKENVFTCSCCHVSPTLPSCNVITLTLFLTIHLFNHLPPSLGLHFCVNNIHKLVFRLIISSFLNPDKTQHGVKSKKLILKSLILQLQLYITNTEKTKKSDEAKSNMLLTYIEPRGRGIWKIFVFDKTIHN